MTDVAAWLRGLGLGQYEAAFRDNAVDDADVLRELTEADLEKLGVGLGDRKRILKAIAALGSSPEGKPETDAAAERRQLSVLFCDLAGSTALSARLDPEDLREVMAAYHRAAAEAVRRQGGYVAKLLGDGMLAYFGWPEAREDDAERAVRAGLAAVEAVAGLRTAAGPLAARVGIATGSVVVGEVLGEGEARERGVVGETPNLAARLQALAEPGAVVVGPTTRALLGDLFEWRDLGATELRGLAGPVRAWQALRPGAIASRFEALHAAAALTPLVGRRDELGLLRRRWRCARAGTGQVVLLSGEPGIGKSRLAAAWQARLEGEPHVRVRHFCSPQHAGSPLFPVISQLERAAGFGREDTAEAKGRKLRALLARTATAPRDAALLAELLSLPADPGLLAALSPQRRREETLAALLRQLEALARRRPVLVVFEDAHWIDPTSRELLDLAVKRVQRVPVLLLVTARPEFRPCWVGRPHVMPLSLGRLGSRDGAALVGRVAAGAAALPAGTVEEIVERADGVPLFLEELTRAVLEAGAGPGDGGTAFAAAPRPSVAVPATLHASLMARLDRLGPAKEVAQVGAAIGREFPHGLLAAVAALSKAALRERLERLVTSGLVHQRGVPPEASYAFKHALVQDAAYGTLLRDRRRELHGRIARAYAELLPERAQAQPELLAHHCAQAGETEAAIAHWERAGRRALDRSAAAEAGGAFEKALELLAGLPEGVERDRRELALRLALAGALLMAKGWASPQTGEAYVRARELCRQAGDALEVTTALIGLYSFHINRAEVGPARDAAQELLRLAERQDDDGGTVRLFGHRAVGNSLVFHADFTGALRHLCRALDLYDPVAHRRSAVAPVDSRVLCRGFAAWVLLFQGHPDAALAAGLEALADARALLQPYALAFALHVHCLLRQVRGDWAALGERAAELVALAAEQSFPHLLATGTFHRGWAMLAAGGAADPAIAEMWRGLAAKRATGAELKVPYYLGLLAAAQMRAGRASEAPPLLAEALARVERTGERWFEAELHRLQGEALLAVSPGDRETAEACFRRALAVAERQGAKWWGLRAATSLARLRRDQRRLAEARGVLAPVYAAFTEGFGLPDLVEARALLEELGAPPAVGADRREEEVRTLQGPDRFREPAPDR